MADEIYLASLRMDALIDGKIEQARQSAKASPAATGQCLNCQADLPPNLRWCDIDCRDDWQARHEP
jgi:hypothetical protein